LRSHQRAAATCQDHVGREREQLGCGLAGALDVARGPANVDLHVSAGGPAQRLQLLHERRVAGLCFRIVRGECREHADAAHALGLLRARFKRPRRRRAAE
jgi:hypothetical protein